MITITIVILLLITRGELAESAKLLRSNSTN